ncbi:Maltase-glucoamylase, intestinal, partial [Stegodyphus mimosarum]
MSEKYLQIASYLPSKNIYGLGEHVHETFRHSLNYVSWPLFSRDRPPMGGQKNLYGVHPFYTCLENDGKSHGVLLLNSNAMEVTLLPTPAISFRTIGGVLDFFVFVGENPEHVVQLYTSLIGRPILPPYWSLGFQLSRYGYNKLENVKAVVERTRNAGIMQNVQFLDIDHMEGKRDFTWDNNTFAGLPEYIQQTKKNYGLKWIIILDPAIEVKANYSSYESGINNNVFIRRSPLWPDSIFPPAVQDLNVTFGRVWPRDIVAFPDFFLKSAKQWWINQIVEHHSKIPFDGLWIDMNEPANFQTNEDDPEYCKWDNIPKDQCWALRCPTSSYDDPPYNPLEKSESPRLSTMTLCMESIQGEGNKSYRHYDVHSLYGWSQTLATKEAAESATGTRSLVISRSTYPSSGNYSGHWLGDNRSQWPDLHRSIIGMLEFNLFGIP